MPHLQLYEKLLELPLFQGMSRDDLDTVVGQTRFNFGKFRPGEVVAKAGTECHHILFLLTGSLTVESKADDYSYAFIEDIAAPHMLQPEYLFGISPRYTRTYIAREDCSFITLSKTETLKLTDDFIIFKLNLLNIISTRAQKAAQCPWRPNVTDLRSLIYRFFSTHCLYPAGHKTVVIKMVKLAEELNDSRLDISRALNQMQSQGLLQLYRGRIIIPKLELLK